MRTTLEIDDDVLLAAKELAIKQRKTAGKIVSEIFRRGMRMGSSAPAVKEGQPYAMKNGIPILPSRGELVTTEHVQRVMEKENL
ncbi:MAG: CopG family transcriptional regulator [Verrucomicrobiota bacterium]